MLFIAGLNNKSASGRQRLWAIQQCGIEVTTVNIDQFKSKFGSVTNTLAKLFKRPEFTKNIFKLEKKILQICQNEHPKIIWFEWPKDFKTQFIERLKIKLPNSIFISFQDDNPWGDRVNDFWMWKNYFRLIPYFDLHLIKRESDYINLVANGGKSFYYWKHGVYNPIFFPMKQELKYKISFIGTCMDSRADLIEFLLENGIPIHVFGSHWKKRSNLPKRFPNNFHDEVVGYDYANVIRSSQICLGLVSKSNHDEWTMRTFEVPGCAKLLLAEKTQFHQELFVEDKEIQLFNGKEECLKKIQYLLIEPELCDDIGRAAHQKCLIKGWFIEINMKNFLDKLSL